MCFPAWTSTAHARGKKDVAAADVLARLATDLDLRRSALGSASGDSRSGRPRSASTSTPRPRHETRMRVGRDGNLFALVGGTVMRRVRPDHVPLVVRYDGRRLDDLLDAWGRDVDQGVVEGGLRFEGTKVVAIAPHSGTGLQRDEGRREIVRALGRADRTDEVVLPFGKVVPQVDQTEVDVAAARARSLLAGNREIRAARPARRADTGPARGDARDSHHRRHARPDDRYRQAAPHARSSHRSPRERADRRDVLGELGEHRVGRSVACDGTVLDFDAIARDILTGSVSSARTCERRIRPTTPHGRGIWHHQAGLVVHDVSPAGEARVHNIHLAADVLNNTVVEPGLAVLAQREAWSAYAREGLREGADSRERRFWRGLRRW